jgi:4-alpha-glucanotransferase
MPVKTKANSKTNSKTTPKKQYNRLPEEVFERFPTAEAWRKVGHDPRFGVMLPLTYLRTKRNQGVGDFVDIPILKEFSEEIGSTILQFLPLNDMGRGKCPYSAISAFALDPVFIGLDEVPEMKENPSEAVMSLIRENYHIVEEQKAAECLNIDLLRAFKFRILYQLFWDFIDRNREQRTSRWHEFESWQYNNQYWLDDYAMFRCLKNKFNWTSWQDWPVEYRERQKEALDRLKMENHDEILYVKYIQWVAYNQMVEAHNECRRDNVMIKGDIPLQVDFESADVWSYPQYFNLNYCAGAPPDQYSMDGQNWGTPTFNWVRLGMDNYMWWRKRLEYSSHFYDIYRIDHIVGLFHIWTNPVNNEFPRGKACGWHGFYVPEDKGEGEHKPVWENHGKTLLKMMIESTEMLPIGEDLGNIPYVCYHVMKNMGIPGYKIVIWERDWSKPGSPVFDPEDFDYLSMTSSSTHDFWTLPGYWVYRDNDDRAVGQEENIRTMWKYLMGNKKFSPEYTEELHEAFLDKMFNSNSMLLLIPFQDLWGQVPGYYGDDIISDRINDPSHPEKECNWSGRMPLDIEDYSSHKQFGRLVKTLKDFAVSSSRYEEKKTK